MPKFENNDLTNAGLVLMSKAAAGEHIKYTRLVMGQGFMPKGKTARDMTAVVEPFADLPIEKLKVLEGDDVGLVAIGGSFSNEMITKDKFYRELAAYAIDPDIGEILYCYANAGMNAELIPAPGGANPIQKSIDIITSIGTAENISARIPNELHASKAEFEAHLNDEHPHLVLPPGIIVPYAVAEPPFGWLLCKGQAVSRIQYRKLFETIGVKYGTGDGITTFNLPNMTGRFPLGFDANCGVGQTGGSVTHKLEKSELPNCTFDVIMPGTLGFSRRKLYGDYHSGTEAIARPETKEGVGNPHSPAYVQLDGGRQPHNNMPPYISLAHIIKF